MSSCFKERNERLYTFAILKFLSYWIKVHQIYKQCSQIIADKLFEIRMAILNPSRNARAMNKGE